jgi:uncharacterized protein YndB with AHSA1/START domain
MQLLEFSCTIQATPAEVCRAFTHATLLRDWLCNDARNSPRPGGYLFLHWSDGRTVTGNYKQLDLPQALQFTWFETGLPVTTRVRIACKAVGQETRLELTHESLEEIGGWEALSPRLKALWDDSLENLVSVVETGIDLRLARRPRLGILMEDELTPERASKLGVPVAQGVLLQGTAEGTGAQAAGLLKGDVLVGLNGVPLRDPSSFDAALRGLKAGDSPVIEYYRGAEKHSTALTLGSFPIPELPIDAAGLAEKVQALNAEVLAAMRAQLEGLSEGQAAARPAEGEWSAREMVAHFILSERDYQSWVADMLNDTPVEDWLQMRPNVGPRVAALVARMPGLAELFKELLLAQEETAAMIAYFPESFTRDRKHLYRRAAQWALEVIPGHYFDEHKEQFQAAIEAARGVPGS